MLSFLKKQYRSVIIGILILISFIGMLVFKRLGELSRSEYHDNFFALFQMLFVGTIGYMAISWLFGLWKQYQRLKNDKATAELALLKSKIDPHFFFNTLNNLYGLAVEKSDEAPQIILKLSEVMRYTIYEGERETVSLKEEVSYLEQYIEIHKIRYKRKVDILFEKEIHDPKTQISPLLFIMLLENAFKHGVDRLTDNAYIQLQLIAKNKNVSFRIENNYEEHSKSKKGIGLENLKRRLQLTYPKRHDLIFSANAGIFKATLTIQLT